MISESILSVDEVSLAAYPPYEEDLADVTLNLSAGDLALVRMVLRVQRN